MMENSRSTTRVAKARESSGAAPAPLIFAAALLAGVLLSLAFPVRFLPRTLTLVVGLVCSTVPFVLGFAALGAMRRAKTSVLPQRPTTALVTDGPFRLSRNPLYLAMVVTYIGLALLFSSLWALVLLPLALVVIHFTVIAREERYLERTFGEDYRAYKARVRRWI